MTTPPKMKMHRSNILAERCQCVCVSVCLRSGGMWDRSLDSSRGVEFGWGCGWVSLDDVTESRAFCFDTVSDISYQPMAVMGFGLTHMLITTFGFSCVKCLSESPKEISATTVIWLNVTQSQ